MVASSPLVDLVALIARSLVDQPDQVVVREVPGDRFPRIELDRRARGHRQGDRQGRSHRPVDPCRAQRRREQGGPPGAPRHPRLTVVLDNGGTPHTPARWGGNSPYPCTMRVPPHAPVRWGCPIPPPATGVPMSQGRETRLVALAEVARPHGIAGELRLKVYNLDSDLLRRRPPITLRLPDGIRPGGRPHGRPRRGQGAPREARRRRRPERGRGASRRTDPRPARRAPPGGGRRVLRVRRRGRPGGAHLGGGRRARRRPELVPHLRRPPDRAGGREADRGAAPRRLREARRRGARRGRAP